jgi:hypothetical protein
VVAVLAILYLLAPSEMLSAILEALIARIIGLVQSALGTLEWANNTLQEGLGALLGAIIGLMGVAYTTRKGFQQIARSNELQHQLQNERDEKSRQGDVASLSSALHAELSTAKINLSAQRVQLKILQAAQKAIETYGRSIVFVPPFEIYRATTHRIGTLDPDMGGEIVRSINLLAFVSQRAERLSLKYPKAIPATELGPIIDDLDRALEVMEGACSLLKAAVQLPDT